MSGLGKLPKGWERTRLGSIADLVMGQAPPGSECNKHGIGVPFVKAGEFGEIRPIEREWTTKPLRFGEEDDVFICVVGATAGKLNLGKDCAIGRSVAAIRPRPGVLGKFVYYQLQPKVLQLRANSSGSAQGAIRRRELEDLDLLIAPEQEQCRIVAKLDELMSEFDATTKSLAEARTHIDQYEESLLWAAVTGSLTVDWRQRHPDAEPGTRILQRLGESEELQPRPESRPSGWAWTTLGRIAEVAGGITKGQKRKAETKYRTVPYLRVANVQRGFLDLSEVKTIQVSEDKIDALSLAVGDVLFNEGGDRDKLGRGWIWNGELELCVHQNHVFRARLRSKDVQSRFLSYHGNTFGRDWFMKKGKQSVNLASINKTILNSFPVPLPPAAEQVEIVDRVERGREQLERVRCAIDRNLSGATVLRRLVLTEAFAGGFAVDLISSGGRRP